MKRRRLLALPSIIVGIVESRRVAARPNAYAYLSIFISAAFIVLTGIGPAPSGRSAADELVRLNAELQKATMEYDVATLAKLITPNYMLISASGRVYGHDAFLTDAADRTAVYEMNDAEDVFVHQYSEDAAVVTAILHVKFHTNTRQIDTRIRYGDVWIKQGGDWKYVFGEASPIKGPITTARLANVKRQLRDDRSPFHFE